MELLRVPVGLLLNLVQHSKANAVVAASHINAGKTDIAELLKQCGDHVMQVSPFSLRHIQSIVYLQENILTLLIVIVMLQELCMSLVPQNYSQGNAHQCHSSWIIGAG